MKYLIIGALLGLNACVSGPKDKDRSVADNLNGANYSSADVVAGVPVLTRDAVERRVSGIVQCTTGDLNLPAGHVRVELVSDGEVVVATLTEGDGHYTLNSKMNPETVYQIHIKGSCGQVTRDLPKSFKGTRQENFLLKRAVK